MPYHLIHYFLFMFYWTDLRSILNRLGEKMPHQQSDHHMQRLHRQCHLMHYVLFMFFVYIYTTDLRSILNRLGEKIVTLHTPPAVRSPYAETIHRQCRQHTEEYPSGLQIAAFQSRDQIFGIQCLGFQQRRKSCSAVPTEALFV